MRWRRVVAVCWCAALLATASGCSAFLLKRPPADPAAPLDCTESVALPVLDTLLAGGLLVGAFFLSRELGTSRCELPFLDAASCLGHAAGVAVPPVSFLVPAGGFGASGIDGFVQTHRCRGARAEAEASCQAGDGFACERLRAAPRRPAAAGEEGAAR